MSTQTRSVSDAETPPIVRERSAKGLAAWDRAMAAETEPQQLQELKDAYSHFRMAARDAGRLPYAEIMFYGNLAGLLSGEVTGAYNRFKAANEASSVSLRNDWLVLLFSAAVQDVTGMRLAGSRGRAHVWGEAERHNETSFALSYAGVSLASLISAPPAVRRKFNALIDNILRRFQMNLNAPTEASEEGLSAQGLALVLESMADEMSNEKATAAIAAKLFAILASAPLEAWSESSETEEIRRTPQEHRDHAEARANLKLQTPSGCLGILVLCLGSTAGAVAATEFGSRFLL